MLAMFLGLINLLPVLCSTPIPFDNYSDIYANTYISTYNDDFYWTNMTNMTIFPNSRFLGYTDNNYEPSTLEIEEISRQVINNYQLSNYIIPPIIDYRNLNNSNYITSVKYQGSCGSCVAFAAIAVLESQYKMKGNNLDLSETDLFFCKGDRQCESGWNLWGVSNVLKNNNISDDKHCPYQFKCYRDCPNNIYKIKNYYYFNNINEMKHWLINNGTLLTRMNVYHDFFQYNGGIYTKRSNTFIGGHAVVIIGYNDHEKYWIAKNSWGTNWGEDGFFRIKYGESGIMPYAYGYTIDNVPPKYQRSINSINNITPYLTLLISLIYFFT